MATPSQLLTHQLEPKNHQRINSYGWFPLWIGLGLLLAILLLVSSISTYVLVSRRLTVEQLRGDLASVVAMLDQQVQRGGVKNGDQFAALLQQAQD